jgi:beta-N-acetylglucosaminidase
MKKILLFLILFLLCLPITVKAEIGYTTDKTGINLRTNPSTSSSASQVIITIPYEKEFYISNLNAAPAGNGCGNVWYYAYYEGQYGYVCSNIVAIVGVTKTTYNRPWTTPKKAIVGGAIFIGNGYISKGQSTSYLKKFNVNPTGTYALYNNQYMANLRAPAGESYRTYTTLNNNKLLTSSYTFLIPVYNADTLPEQKYVYDGLYSGYDKPVINDVVDAEFEKTLVDFPDSYKPYLRYLHSIHNNWIFNPLKTGLNLNDVVSNEKWISSIEISSNYCDQENYKVTESGWCVATDDATRYFLDVRNFLTEKYIFMFEDLGFNSNITESVVQSELNGTFMSGLSVLDNQTYASIFIEAGANADARVSPLYLASLSIQEVGTKGGITTSGASFDYEGYTYSGLYNFFNIGAYSSEENPAKAGLVYANGGKGANSATPTDPGNTDPIPKPTESTNFLEMLSASITDNYLNGYSIGTNISTIKNNVGSRATVEVKDESGRVKADGEFIGTGNMINIKNTAGAADYTYVLYGDLTGDGEINSADLLKLRLHLLGTNTLSGAYVKAANPNKDAEINSADLLKIRQYLLGTASIDQ